jgi:hypothetical protein
MACVRCYKAAAAPSGGDHVEALVMSSFGFAFATALQRLHGVLWQDAPRMLLLAVSCPLSLAVTHTLL